MTTSTILSDLRRRGILVRRAPSGRLQVSGSIPVTESIRQEIREHEAEILQDLDREAVAAIARADAKAQEILAKAKPSIPKAVATEMTDELVYMSCRRRNGSGWTISIPAEEYDPWRLSAEILASASPEDISARWRKKR